MKFLKRFDTRANANGTKIPSPCIICFNEDNKAEILRPAGKKVINEEIYTLQQLVDKTFIASDTCTIGDSEVLAVVQSAYNISGGGSPKYLMYMMMTFTKPKETFFQETRR